MTKLNAADMTSEQFSAATLIDFDLIDEPHIVWFVPGPSASKLSAKLVEVQNRLGRNEFLDESEVSPLVEFVRTGRFPSFDVSAQVAKLKEVK